MKVPLHFAEMRANELDCKCGVWELAHESLKEVNMERWSVEKLKLWREHPCRKPMLLLGARQVGKNVSLQSFYRRYRRPLAVRTSMQPYAVIAPAIKEYCLDSTTNWNFSG